MVKIGSIRAMKKQRKVGSGRVQIYRKYLSERERDEIENLISQMEQAADDITCLVESAYGTGHKFTQRCKDLYPVVHKMGISIRWHIKMEEELTAARIKKKELCVGQN